MKRLLLELSQANIDSVLSYLRLAEIINLNWAIHKSHKLVFMKQMLIKALILSTRQYSKWEEQEFLDLLLAEDDSRYRKADQLIKISSNS